MKWKDRVRGRERDDRDARAREEAEVRRKEVMISLGGMSGFELVGVG